MRRQHHVDVRFTPLPLWSHPTTHKRRPRNTFKAGWQDTLDLMENELRILEATNVIIGIRLESRHIRLDGWPRSDAPNPSHPGVELSFDSGSIGRLDPNIKRGTQLIALCGGDAKAALKKHHPDVGGRLEDIVAINAAMDPKKRLIYACDVCDFWQHNVRSIALGLGSLRAVDRYGISSRGEQYAGFRGALTAKAST